MKVSVLCVGDELLKGINANTNSKDIGEALSSIGIQTSFSLETADSSEKICEALDFLSSQTDIIIITGGLGPTDDDISCSAVSSFFKLKMVENKEVLKQIERFWNRRRPGKAVPGKIFRQAMVPEKSIIIKNNVGTAPGIIIHKELNTNKKIVFLLPGPPAEMKAMLYKKVIPEIKKNLKKRIYTKEFRIIGIPESTAEEKIAPYAAEYPEISIAYCASIKKLKLFLNSENKEILNKFSKISEKVFADSILRESDTLQDELVALLKRKKLTISTAESCTGGMIASAITDVPGSSEVFPGAMITYSNEEKIRKLGIDRKIIEKYGAVSSETVSAMCEGVSAKFATDCSIAVSGIAGPGGGSDKKPVGLVYIAVKYNERKEIKRSIFHGNRAGIRERTVYSSLNILRKMLKK